MRAEPARTGVHPASEAPTFPPNGRGFGASRAARRLSRDHTDGRLNGDADALSTRVAETHAAGVDKSAEDSGASRPEYSRVGPVRLLAPRLRPPCLPAYLALYVWGYHPRVRWVRAGLPRRMGGLEPSRRGIPQGFNAASRSAPKPCV